MHDEKSEHAECSDKLAAVLQKIRGLRAASAFTDRERRLNSADFRAAVREGQNLCDEMHDQIDENAQVQHRIEESESRQRRQLEELAQSELEGWQQWCTWDGHESEIAALNSEQMSHKQLQRELTEQLVHSNNVGADLWDEWAVLEQSAQRRGADVREVGAELAEHALEVEIREDEWKLMVAEAARLSIDLPDLDARQATLDEVSAEGRRLAEMVAATRHRQLKLKYGGRVVVPRWHRLRYMAENQREDIASLKKAISAKECAVSSQQKDLDSIIQERECLQQKTEVQDVIAGDARRDIERAEKGGEELDAELRAFLSRRLAEEMAQHDEQLALTTMMESLQCEISQAQGEYHDRKGELSDSDWANCSLKFKVTALEQVIKLREKKWSRSCSVM